MCIPCPDINHMTLGPAQGINDCVCKHGFLSNGTICESKLQIMFNNLFRKLNKLLHIIVKYYIIRRWNCPVLPKSMFSVRGWF